MLVTWRRERKRVVVVGGGFGGLLAVKGLRRADVDVTLVDRQNYHLFQPLAYQVATGALSAVEIATPLRRILRRQQERPRPDGRGDGLRSRAAGRYGSTVCRTAPTACSLDYDKLVVAGGSAYSYFGHDDWAAHAPELKSLDGRARAPFADPAAPSRPPRSSPTRQAAARG